MFFDRFSYKVSISTDGRSGHVHYSEGPLHSCQFYWEFGGREVVAWIDVPTPENWDAEISWAAGRRAEVLERVAREVRRQQCPSCTPRITDQWIEMVEG